MQQFGNYWLFINMYSVHSIGHDLRTYLIHRRSSTVTEFLLSKGIPVDIDYGHGTALYQAAANEQDKTVKILLDHHANVYIPDA